MENGAAYCPARKPFSKGWLVMKKNYVFLQKGKSHPCIQDREWIDSDQGEANPSVWTR